METLKAILLLALIGVLLSLIERLAPLNRAQPAVRKDALIDFGYLLANAAVFAGVLASALAPFALAVNGALPVKVYAGIAGQPLWLQWFEILILADLGVYLGHRLMHEVGWLWKFHAIHHSAAQLDWMTSFRNHPIDLLVIKFCMLLPIAALPFDAQAVGAYGFYYALQSAFVHANVRISFGRLGIIYAGPEFHRWHHSDLPEARDKNFVSIFPWVDWLFGTYYLPRRFPETFGTNDPVPDSYVGQLLYPLWRVRQSAKS